MSENRAESDSAVPQKPTEIRELEDHVEWEVTHLRFDPDDHKTVSLVVRGEDGEILAEGTRAFRSGIYALVQIDREAENPDEYGIDREDPPEWVQWRFKEPPLDHFVEAIECSECGEANDYILEQTPDVVGSYNWEQIRHKGTCEHASEEDRESWPHRKKAREIKGRQTPRTMALPCLWEEIDELREYNEHPNDTLHEAAEDRLVSIGYVLEERLLTRYPDCPECGEEIRLRDRGYADCSFHHANEEATEEFWRQYARVWGRRGHLGRGRRGGDSDGE